jgi:hypothetical protein
MHFVHTVQSIRERAPGATIEILTPDFLRKDGWENRVIDAALVLPQIDTVMVDINVLRPERIPLAARAAAVRRSVSPASPPIDAQPDSTFGHETFSSMAAQSGCSSRRSTGGTRSSTPSADAFPTTASSPCPTSNAPRARRP